MNNLGKGTMAESSGGPVRAGRAGFFCLVFLLSLIALPLGAQDVSKRDLQSMYLSYLRGEGYSPRVDDEGDIAFEKNDLNFYILVDEDDLEYFNLLFPGIYSVDNQQDRQRAADAISKVNRERKVAKVYLNSEETTVSVAAEIFVRRPGDFAGTFTRMFNNVLLAAQDFLEAMED
jgi:hypothetical protein